MGRFLSSGDDAAREEGKRYRDKIRSAGIVSSCRELFFFLKERLFEIRLGETASTMALASLLGIVPVLAISLAVFAAFPSFEHQREALEALILTSFIPEQYSEIIVSHLREFSSHAAGLTTFGAVGLVFTCVLLLNKLFATMNRIFRIRRARPFAERLLLYWALVTLGPLFIALSLSLTGRLAAFTLQEADPGFARLFYSLGSLFLQAFAFAVIYKFVPYCSVRFSHAFFSGLAVSLIGFFVKRIFAYYVSVGTFSNIYGAFAALPVLIIWIYVAWYLFFAGAAMTAVIPQLLCSRYNDHFKAGNSFYTALAFLDAFIACERRGKAPILSLSELCLHTNTAPQDARFVLEQLSRIHYVKAISAQEDTELWALIANTENATVRRVFHLFVLDAKNRLLQNPNDSVALWSRRFEDNEALNTPLREIFNKKDQIP